MPENDVEIVSESTAKKRRGKMSDQIQNHSQDIELLNGRHKTGVWRRKMIFLRFATLQIPKKFLKIFQKLKKKFLKIFSKFYRKCCK